MAKIQSQAQPRKRPVAVVKAASTYDGNGNEDVTIEEQSTSKLKNNMSTEMLIEPPEDEGGSTYTAIQARAQKPQARRKVKAADFESTNVGTMSNLDPDAIGIDKPSPGDQGNATPQILKNSDTSDALLVADEEEFDTGDDEFADDSDIEQEAEDVDSLEPELPVAMAEDTEVPPGSETLNLLDIDEVDDKEGPNTVFAAVDNRLCVIHANRIIATLTPQRAAKREIADTYLTQQFQEVTATAMTRQGLRKGLKSMGFVLASVNVAKSAVVNARVTRQAQQTTAAIRKVADDKSAVMDQSLAIASVGVNRSFFKDVANPLRDSLTQLMASAGVKGGDRAVARIFAEHGPSYAKSILTLATKLSAYGEEARANLIDALDMTNGDADAQVLPIGADDMTGDPDEGISDAYSDDGFDDVEVVSTVEAQLATAGTYSRPQRVSASAGQFGVAANAMLNGDVPMFRL